MFALGAYGCWGLAPIYFKWVEFASLLDVLAHRAAWAFLILFTLVVVRRQWRAVAGLSYRDFGWLAVSGTLVSISWITYIWALQHGRIVEASLGYYINPLVTIVLGIVFLHERLCWRQTLAVALAALGVVNEMLAFGALPWAGLLLAGSFGFYGLVRKRIHIDPIVGLGVETGLMFPLALAFLTWRMAKGQGVLATGDGAQIALLALSGLVTVVPLTLFAAAAMRLNLIALGFYQYLAPTLILLVAIYYYGQPIADGQWLTFGCIWAALAVISIESAHKAWRLRRHRRQS